MAEPKHGWTIENHTHIAAQTVNYVGGGSGNVYNICQNVSGGASYSSGGGPHAFSFGGGANFYRQPQPTASSGCVGPAPSRPGGVPRSAPSSEGRQGSAQFAEGQSFETQLLT